MNGLHPCTLPQRAPFGAVSRVSPLCAAFCPDSECVCGAAEKAHVAPTCGQRGKSRIQNAEEPRRSGKNPPEREDFPRRGGGFSALGCRIALAFFTLSARWRNVGFSRCAAHTLAVGAESRTQRRHAPHGGERCLLRKGARMQNRSRRYPLTLLLRQAPEPLVGAALRKNAEISLCNFQRPL